MPKSCPNLEQSYLPQQKGGMISYLAFHLKQICPVMTSHLTWMWRWDTLKPKEMWDKFVNLSDCLWTRSRAELTMQLKDARKHGLSNLSDFPFSPILTLTSRSWIDFKFRCWDLKLDSGPPLPDSFACLTAWTTQPSHNPSQNGSGLHLLNQLNIIKPFKICHCIFFRTGKRVVLVKRVCQLIQPLAALRHIEAPRDQETETEFEMFEFRASHLLSSTMFNGLKACEHII